MVLFSSLNLRKRKTNFQPQLQHSNNNDYYYYVPSNIFARTSLHAARDSRLNIPQLSPTLPLPLPLPLPLSLSPSPSLPLPLPLSLYPSPSPPLHLPLSLSPSTPLPLPLFHKFTLDSYLRSRFRILTSKMLWDKTRPRAASQKKKIGQWHVMLSHPDFQIGAKFISTNSSSNINRIDMFIGPANEDWNTEGFYWSFIHIIIYDNITPVFFAFYTSIGCSPSSRIWLYASIVSSGSLGVAEKYIITSLFFPFTYVRLSARGDERKKGYT